MKEKLTRASTGDSGSGDGAGAEKGRAQTREEAATAALKALSDLWDKLAIHAWPMEVLWHVNIPPEVDPDVASTVCRIQAMGRRANILERALKTQVHDVEFFLRGLPCRRRTSTLGWFGILYPVPDEQFPPSDRTPRECAVCRCRNTDDELGVVAGVDLELCRTCKHALDLIVLERAGRPCRRSSRRRSPGRHELADTMARIQTVAAQIEANADRLGMPAWKVRQRRWVRAHGQVSPGRDAS